MRKAVGWLEAQNDALGCELANAVDALCSGRAAPITKGALLPRVALLKGFKPLEHALLAQHLAPLASLCSWRRYAIGDEVELASTESAVVAKGAVAVPAAVLERGGSLQPWHAVRLGEVAGWRPSRRLCGAVAHASVFRAGAGCGRVSTKLARRRRN